MTPDEIRSLVRDELASLGGHLLSVYGNRPQEVGDYVSIENITLAALGGYLLEHYSAAHQHADITPERKAELKERLLQRSADPEGFDRDALARGAPYRDPEPPAVGEPPTTTPGT